MKEIPFRQNSSEISQKVSPALLLYVSAGNSQRALVDESGYIYLPLFSGIQILV
jgi:hypothetical protein